MQKSRSRKGNYEHEKWLRGQRILGICVFILTIYGSYVGQEISPALLGLLIMCSTFIPDKKAEEEWK